MHCGGELKYGSKHFDLKAENATLPSSKGPWKFINHEGDLVFSNIRGSGVSTMCWINHWIGQNPLFIDYPMLLPISG